MCAETFAKLFCFTCNHNFSEKNGMLVRVQFEVWRAKILWGHGLALQVPRNTFLLTLSTQNSKCPSPGNYMYSNCDLWTRSSSAVHALSILILVWKRGSKRQCPKFDQYFAITPTRCEIACRLLVITNRKSHTGFRLVPTSMTLNDLEWRNSPYSELFHRTR